MNFEPTPEEKLAVEGFRRFLERDIAPIVARHRDEVFPKPVAHQLLASLCEYGIGNGWVPDEAGGLGIGYIASGLLYEELARLSPDLAGLAYVHEGATMKLVRGGTDTVKERYLPGLLSGQLIGCSAVTEPGGGSGVRAMRTRAVIDGDGYRVNGEKTFISNAPIADVIMLTALTGPQEFTMFLVDPREHGVQTREISKLGLTSWSLGEVVFNDTWISREYVIGGVGAGLRETMRGFERARVFISILALGIGQAALEAAIQSGVRCYLEAAMAKAFATEAAVRITSRAIQVHGAYGLTREFLLERHFRDARMLTVPDGTTQIIQLVIGRELLGLDAFGAGPK